MMRIKAIHLTSLLILLFIVSTFLTIWITGMTLPAKQSAIYASATMENQGAIYQDLTIEIPLYRTKENKVEKLPLEEYLIGVVAAEMPPEFEMEALKAQAITARTYLIRRIVEKDFSDVPTGAWVNDSIQHQVYLDDETLREQWGALYEENRAKIARSVKETEGLILTYQNQPINATFFSTSNGYTENAEEYWQTEIPYLRSVPSPWDLSSPRYKETIRMPIETFEQKLGVKVSNLGDAQNWSKVIDRTTGKRINRIIIGNKTFTGREVREKLELNSSSFTWQRDKDQLLITTYGYGHGVGMSQWGADGMAKEGKKAVEILKYYYQGVELTDYREWIIR
jgi:stage II sporulation protein D